jgi:imidazolonepropionase-like amidohydrolase
MAHVYTDEGIRRCLDAGVRSIEHGNFASQETIAAMPKYGAYLDPTFISLVQRIESARETGLSDAIVGNLRQTVSRGKEVYRWARQYDVPIAFGTDLWGPEARASQLREFETRMDLDSAANIIRSATVTNAALLMQEDKLGTIAAGACADLLIVDGDPLTDLRVMLNPQKNLKLIMKDGIIYKNALT